MTHPVPAVALVGSPDPSARALHRAGGPVPLVRPAPRADAPYDDELLGPRAELVDGSLALSFPPPTRAAGVPLRLVPPAAPADPPDAGPDLEPPDPTMWTRRLAQVVVEVLAGARPPAQLSRFASLEVLGLLERGAGRFVSRGQAPARRPVVTSVRVSRPSPRVAEACAVVDTFPRRRAVALRLESDGRGWRCTAIQVG